MKKAGFLIFAFGLLITIFTGLTYVTKEVVLDAGDLSIPRDEGHAFTWSPLIGIGIMLIGGAIFITGVKRDTQRSNV
jgi:hypothetical protein